MAPDYLEWPKSERCRSQGPSPIVTRIVVKLIVIALILVAVVDLILPVPRNRSEHDHRSSDGDSPVKSYCVLLRHPHATVRGGITREISCVHANTRGKLHKIPHGRIDELGAGRGWHVHISIRHHGPTAAVNDSSVDTGDVVQVLVGDMKRSCRRQVTGAAGADLGLDDCSVVIKKIGLLLREIELHGILGESDPCKTCKDQNCGDKNFHLTGGGLYGSLSQRLP